VVLVCDLGVSGCQSCRHHHNGMCILGAEAKQRGGKTKSDWKGKREDKSSTLLLTKLMSPRHQVTLSQCNSKWNKCLNQVKLLRFERATGCTTLSVLVLSGQNEPIPVKLLLCTACDSLKSQPFCLVQICIPLRIMSTFFLVLTQFLPKKTIDRGENCISPKYASHTPNFDTNFMAPYTIRKSVF
jgi:hypothetical protein